MEMVSKYDYTPYHNAMCYPLFLAINVRVDSNSAVAEVIIAENDDARGIVEFSSAAVNTTEPNAAGFLTVTRSAGSFGQVKFYIF